MCVLGILSLKNNNIQNDKVSILNYFFCYLFNGISYNFCVLKFINDLHLLCVTC